MGVEGSTSRIVRLRRMSVVSGRAGGEGKCLRFLPFSSTSMPTLPLPNGPLTRLPLAYHIFKSPLSYVKTLALQDAIVQLRLDAKKEDPGSEVARRDVLLLLGRSRYICSRSIGRKERGKKR